MLEFFIGYYLVMAGYTAGTLSREAAHQGFPPTVRNVAMPFIAGVGWPIFAAVKLVGMLAKS